MHLTKMMPHCPQHPIPLSNYDLDGPCLGVLHGSPFLQVSRQCTRLQQQPTPAVKKVISPSASSSQQPLISHGRPE
ncbi:uncharacterized protein LOC135376552 isoform X2 [Ornithodoros turicata]|uniref:uncharacterized protein LOC135376552 isoform X2 n=1 Tax=Ornithodoros turicata TaxID=34597 RepID=UPI00313A1AD0